MRIYFLLASVSLVSACGGGGGLDSAGSVPPTGGIIDSGHTFVEPKEQKVYQAIGGVHSYEYATSEAFGEQREQLYRGNAGTARNSGISVDYSPRDGIFAVKISENLGGVSQDLRFQDPAHRTDFGGAYSPQGGTPNLSQNGVRYLEAGSQTGSIVFDPSQSNVVPVGNVTGSRDVATFFYQQPGTVTRYVTFAGFVRNSTTVEQRSNAATGADFIAQKNSLQRGVFAYGERTRDQDIPRTGSGTYNGAMVATMVFNPLLDDPATAGAPTLFQWIDGSSQTRLDFGSNSFEIDLTGNVLAPQWDVFTDRIAALSAGATFNANGSGRIDILQAGGFLGDFQRAWFVQPNGSRFDVVIAGSSVNGAFFGPDGEEVGGGFRIVGGTPDERIDILGAFTGRRQP